MHGKKQVNIYEQTRLRIIEAGFDPSITESIARKISNSTEHPLFTRLISEFEKEAGKLPWPQDCDFGALVLQYESRKSKNCMITQLMLSSAIERARWCATCATSGGEGLARAQHIQELKNELFKHNDTV